MVVLLCPFYFPFDPEKSKRYYILRNLIEITLYIYGNTSFDVLK